jgi:predicted transposase YbfD/YdcC
VKDNHGELKLLLDEWVAVMRSTTGLSRPDVLEINKGHGRIERRELWAVPGGELGAYLEQEYGWPAMTWCGRIRRKRRPSNRTEEASIEEHTWIFGSRTVEASPEKIARWLRGHWTIENGVFRVLDVSYNEDRLHGRKVGIALSKVRHAAINLIRGLGYHYIPDGWRRISARTDYGLAFVTAPPLLEN